MAPIILPKTDRLTVAHILKEHIIDYQKHYPLWHEHRKIVYDLLNCRTPYLGGHIDRCDHCGALRITYHSCRNRHCPTCQHMPRERWLEQRKQEILPADYFHVVFTLPHELNTVVLNNKKVMLAILFKAASQTLLTFGENELGGKLGFITTLHTWDQKLNAHFHLHCLVAGGAVSPDGSRWIPCKGNYLFNERALSLVFRGKFMELMKKACQCNDLKFAGDQFNRLKSRLYEKPWIIDVRDPVKKPEHVLEYLARYTHRVAIANSRIKALTDGMVTFTFKNRKKNRTETLTVTAVEFIRRFLLHSLPKRFVRIRHYGFLANRNRSANLAAIRQLMGLIDPIDKAVATVESMMQQLTGTDITVCPCCKKGKMLLYREIPKGWARPPNPLAFVAA
ncbi:IS91 family transposase [Desulfosarcina sp.]|uniref:IS91 family transposase n=1 Tax=Desulfosarcina sp. TaxID=2027861 RepID=UPI0029A5DE7D|nr:IS91 family transposase [Desulfosarcina sp.]MDX2489347.1 IS91 family transposase [Desulfosarcina sp.]